MSGVGIVMAANGSTSWSQVGLYVKMPTQPSQPLALLDLDGASLGSFRLYWDGGQGPRAKYTYGGQTCECFFEDTSNFIYGGWFWLNATFGGQSGGGGAVSLQYWAPGGVTAGPTNSGMGVGDPNTDQYVTCNIGWGVDLLGGLNDFPNASGYEMDCLYCFRGLSWPGLYADTVGHNGPPTADPVPSDFTGTAFIYCCRQSLGAVESPNTITDTGGLGLHLAPGPQGATIVGDGPY